MKRSPNSIESRDIASLLHHQTNLARHELDGPTVMTHGKGIYIYDGNREYIDSNGGLWCASLGFSNERLAKVAYEQMRKLGFYHTFRSRSNTPSIELAEELLRLAPVKMAKVSLQSSGSEANDTAIKLVWYYHAAIGRPEKRKIIGRRMSYHGNTCVVASATGRPDMHIDFGLPLPGFYHTEFPHYYRYKLEGESEEEFSSRMAEALETLILREGPETVGGFIAEPVMGAGGAVMPPKTYFAKMQAVLKKYDILFIADEVICGFGRTGNMWGCQTYDLKPDMISCAKALAAAMQPISALFINEKVHRALVSQSEKLGNFAHGYTYSGHPVASAVALETLKIYEEMDMISHVRRVGPHMQKVFKRLVDHELVGDVRGVGLMTGVELVADKRSRKQFDPGLKVGSIVGSLAEENGLIIRVIGDTIAFAPALTVVESEIDEIAKRFEKSLNETVMEISRKRAS
jgi:4-aminobutyrate---pyruvate transaminase